MLFITNLQNLSSILLLRLTMISFWNIFGMRSFHLTYIKVLQGNGAKYLSKSVGRIGEIDFFMRMVVLLYQQLICLGYEHYMGMAQKSGAKLMVEQGSLV